MPDLDQLQNELETFEIMTAGFVGSIVRAAKQIPDDKWNWSFSNATPTAREVCEHTFLWLWCDRQQISVLNRAEHLPVPALPDDQESMIALLQTEADQWRLLIQALSPSQLDEERESWDGETRNVRGFLFHMGQHVIYKAGQMWMLNFGLGLDGDGVYTAPHPNEIYGFPGVPPWPGPRN